MFSAQVDTTQDITTQDQCSVIVRYVTHIIHERLVAVVKCEASIGQYCPVVQVLSEVLENMTLDISKCLGNSTDGASSKVSIKASLPGSLQSPTIKCMCGAVHTF